MSNEVQELLARIGEAAALNALMDEDVLTGETDIPIVRVRTHSIGDDADVSYEINDEPRRLVLVPGFDWMWYNAEGPEE